MAAEEKKVLAIGCTQNENKVFEVGRIWLVRRTDGSWTPATFIGSEPVGRTFVGVGEEYYPGRNGSFAFVDDPQHGKTILLQDDSDHGGTAFYSLVSGKRFGELLAILRMNPHADILGGGKDEEDA